MIWVIIAIIVLIIFIFIVKKFRFSKKSTILAYSGKLGGGKSFNGSADGKKLYNISLRAWKHVNHPFWSWCYLWIPYFNKKRKSCELYGLNKPLLYSNFPILLGYKKGKPIFSEMIDNDIMFMRKSIPLNSIILIDEFSSWISQFDYDEVYSKTLNDHIQKFRHYHGNLSHLIVIDQCSNNIPIQIRYRLNQVICCLNTRHYFFNMIHITDYKCIDLTDDIKSVEILDNDKSDTDDKKLRMIRFIPSRLYDDRAFSNRYFYVDKNEKNTKYIDSPFKNELGLIKPMPKEKYINLDCEIIKSKKG